MYTDFFTLLLISIVGFFVGLLSGLLGIGGGIISVPALIAFGMDPRVAVGTSSVCVLVAVLWGTIQHTRQKTIRWKAVFVTLPSAILFSIYGIYSLSHWNAQLFHALFALFTGICGLLTYLKIRYSKEDRNPKELPAVHWFRVVVGAVAGFVNGAFGVGGGIVIVPLHLVIGDKLKSIVPISLSVIAITSLFSVGMHTSAQNIEWVSAFFLSITTIPGSQVGTYLLKKIDHRWTTAFLIIVLVIVSISSLKKANLF